MEEISIPPGYGIMDGDIISFNVDATDPQWLWVAEPDSTPKHFIARVIEKGSEDGQAI